MLEGNPITVDGIIIPSDHPIFLLIIAIHILAGLTCVISGFIAMVVRKQKGKHTKAGLVYFGAIWVVFITACFVALIRWEEDYHLFLLGVVSFFAAAIAKRAVIRKWKKWPLYHISGMAVSYIFLLIAFYVDNGKFLPLWKEMPHFLYWLLPLLMGLPLLFWTLVKNPLSRSYFKGQG
jgi:hypothetical protein